MSGYGDNYGYSYGNPTVISILNTIYIAETDTAMTINNKFGGSLFGTGRFGISGNNQIQTIANISYTAEI